MAQQLKKSEDGQGGELRGGLTTRRQDNFGTSKVGYMQMVLLPVRWENALHQGLVSGEGKVGQSHPTQFDIVRFSVKSMFI